MKKLFLTLLLLGSLPAFGMEESEKSGFVLKEDGRSITITEPICVTTSDGVRFEFSPSELKELNSQTLNDRILSFEESVRLRDIDASTLTIIKNILEKGLDETLSSYKDDWSNLIDALEFLGATKLLDDVCKWVAKNCDFTKFDGTNTFSTFIKQRRVCYPLQQALARKLCSTECVLKQMCKDHPITLEKYAWFSLVAPDNSFIVTASLDNTAKIWRLNEKRELVGEPIILAGHTDSIYSIAIAKDNSFIVTGSADRTAKIWRLDEKRELEGDPITLEGEHTGSIYSVAIASDNSFIVTGSHDRTAKIWRLDENHELVGEPTSLAGHTQSISSVKIAADNSFIVTESIIDGTAKIWILNENHELADESITLRDPYGIGSVAIASDNSFIVIGSSGKAYIKKLSEKYAVADWSINLTGHRGRTRAVIAADNSFIVTSTSDFKGYATDHEYAKIWRLDEYRDLAGKPITLRGFSAPVSSVAIAADSSFIVTVLADRTAMIWRLNEDCEVAGRPIKWIDDIGSVKIASDNSFIVTGSKGGAVKIWRNLTISDVSELDLAQILVLLKLATSPSRDISATSGFYAIYESLPENLKRIVDK